ncbi:hypothetical protein [Thalassoglobus polymorphus]|uniref:Uncharacterized protein n=1 Tax=Thalassoglobus polymorphus TaxID=2527994 RepID=A0A517QPP8_9PLAN|nr:hypothetical protein [Thalassoglobus polymorphus]QDT33616.1 hypothetical protein Mal48_28700 [Thalassoglobus polymorphus]
MSDTTDDNLILKTLQREITSKNEIIAALTERLEGTADQLDRLQRSGVKPGDAPARPLSSLAQHVEKALETYNELDPEDHFTRIELGIEQILEMLSSGNFASPASSEAESKATSSNVAPPASTNSVNPSGDDDFWAATKARLLGEEVAENDEAESKGDESPDLVTPAEAATVQQNSQFSEQPLHEEPELAEMPAPVVEFDDPVVLLEAVTDRDSYIVYLISRLRNAEAAAYPPVDWSELSNAPSDLVAKLVELHDQLEDQLRQAQLSVSLERAMLTRERAKLAQVKQHLEKEVKRMGGGLGPFAQEVIGSKEDGDRLDKFIEIALRSSSNE